MNSILKRTIRKAEKKTFFGKRVLLRLDFNVVLDEKDSVVDDFRIKKSVPTIEFLRSAGAKTIIISHIGRNKNDSLLPVFEYLGEKIPLSFSSDLSENGIVRAILDMKNGDVLLCENLRQNEGEEKNDISFANRFAQFADIYVNDAFSVSHRPHASIVSLPKLLPSYIGLLFEDEIRNLSVAFNPPKPFLFILGGAKFKTKLPLIKKYLTLADICFIGGALSNNFFKGLGYDIGDSEVDLSENVSDILSQKNLLLPIDVRVQNKKGIQIKKPDNVSQGDKILDAGPKTLVLLEEKIKEAGFVLWNGPLGDYKISSFEEGTEKFIKILAERDFQKGELVVGGGDTSAMISRMGLEKKFPFISTAGGAMLEYLSEKTLPGIEALEKSSGIK